MEGEADQKTTWAWERYLRHLEAIASTARDWATARKRLGQYGFLEEGKPYEDALMDAVARVFGSVEEGEMMDQRIAILHEGTSVKQMSVIQLVFKRGAGTEDDPVRLVTQYWSMGGCLLAERDPEQAPWLAKVEWGLAFDRCEEEAEIREEKHEEELRVRYNIEAGIDCEFDTALIEVAKQHGWHFWASGCDRTTGERDLAFDREELADVPE